MTETQFLIETENICKTFGTFLALDHVSLSVAPGVTGLLGPNGAGKSTLIKLLLGLLKANQGTGRMLDYRIGIDNRQIRAAVGYMPEDDCFLYGLTGIETVQFAAQLSRFPATEGLRRAHEILDYCGLAQERYRLVETYSTGMRQKLRFAQAIVHDPPILILDEPTAGLDPEERQSMLRRIQRLSQEHGKTVILCTHILPDVQAICDHVVILAEGQLRVAAPLRDLSQPKDPAVHVRILGTPDKLIQQLAQQDVGATLNGRNEITVAGQWHAVTRTIWRSAHATGTVIRSLSPASNSLEQIFLQAVEEEHRART